MQTPRLPKYLMLSSFALLTATTSLIFNDHEIKADTAENTAATAVSTTVSNTVVLNSTAQTDIASSAVADDTASLSDSASSAAGEQRASSSADVLTEVTTPDTGNVTQSDASWTLKGLGNYTFAQVDYYNSNQTAQPAGQLSINASGKPHSYFPNAQYARITGSRGSETLFDQTFIGDQNYRFKQTLQLQAGDILSIEHAEAKTRYTTNNDATMKTSALGDLSRFVFVVANNLSLKNISDYAYLDVKTKQLIDNGALAFGASASDVATLQNQLDNQQADLTTEQRALLQTRLDQAKALLANTTNSINVGQTMTYQGFVLSPDASITQTNKEGRYMGTYHDRQSLGMVLSDGATLKIRHIDNGYSGSVSIQLIGDSSKKIVTQSVGTDWVEITANGDAAVFLRTPENAQTTGPLLEYELVSGTAKELPVFTADSDQAAVLKQWDQSKAAFALMDANNIEILIPYQDIKTVKNTDMNSLIEELFLYAKLDSNSVTYSFAKVNVDAYFQDCVEEISLDLESQGVDFGYFNYADRDTVIIADPEQLKRVVNNIIGNSVKYASPDRKLMISLRIMEEAEFVKIEIEDNGKGIARNEVPLIFDRCYRTDASRNSSKGGSGLGLSIAKKIIEEHGGKIWAVSTEGVGTTMCFVLRKYKENNVYE